MVYLKTFSLFTYFQLAIYVNTEHILIMFRDYFSCIETVLILSFWYISPSLCIVIFMTTIWCKLRILYKLNLKLHYLMSLFEQWNTQSIIT